MARRVRIIGCGNADAGDDALGPVAAARLRGCVPVSVEVCDAGPASRVLDLLSAGASGDAKGGGPMDGDADLAILIDAVRSGGGSRPPGTLIRAEGRELASALRGSLSSHGIGLAESVALAEALGGRTRVVFHGIEAATTRIGAPMSHAVASALPSLIDAVLRDVDAALSGEMAEGVSV